LLVDKSVTISGPAAASLAVDGNSNSRVFHIAAGTTVTTSGLTISHGNATGSYPDRKGGGIYNDHAALTVDNCLVSNNTAMDGGGGVSNDNGTLTMINCKLGSINITGDRGGGMLNERGTLSVNNCVVGPDNWAYSGAGIHNNGATSRPTIGHRLWRRDLQLRRHDDHEQQYH
jgi:hypothetical protein